MKTKLLAILAILAISAVSALLAQGPLTPPGAPAPTMKTLHQIEPRTEINATNTPGDADSSFKITRAGSYYLTANLDGVAAKHGIEIAVNDATLDLNGFALNGVAGSLGGVIVSANVGGLTIRNGTARGWGQSGFGTSNANGCILENLQAASNGFGGILAGENATVRDCTARTNTGIGISAQSGSTIVRCTAGGNTTTGIGGSGFSVTISNCAASSNGGIGIRANNNCTVSDCVSRVNGSHGIELGDHCTLKGSTSDANTGSSNGIDAGDHASLLNCTATGNPGTGITCGTGSTLTNCSAAENAGTSGINATPGSTLVNCSAADNTGSYGILASFGCTLTDCTAYSNDVTFGISAGSGSTLKNCAARANAGTAATSAGIDAGSGCTLIGCSASGNTSTNGGTTAGMGIRVAGSTTIRDCTCDGNDGDGIQVNGPRCHIVGNTCTTNVGGIHLLSTADACRVDGNHVSNNILVNIWIEGTSNSVVRNSSERSQLSNYEIVSGNSVGAIVVSAASPAISGNGAFASSLGSTDPWANFSIP